MSQTTKNASKTRRTRAQWESILSDYHLSGLGAPTYCEQHDIAYASFSKWRSLLKHADRTDSAPKARSNPETISFIELPRTDPNTETHKWNIELALGSGVVLRLKSG